MYSLGKTAVPLMMMRLAFVYHLISRNLGKHGQHSSKPKPASHHSAFSAILIVGLMTVGTIFAISMLQLIFADVN